VALRFARSRLKFQKILKVPSGRTNHLVSGAGDTRQESVVNQEG
jgi:hypothetical protein